MDPWVAGIWIATLAIIVLVVTPLVLYLCWRLVRAARNIERHFSVTLDAAVGIVEHTAAVSALEETIGAAGQILQTAGAVEKTSGAIETLLLSRFEKGVAR